MKSEVTTFLHIIRNQIFRALQMLYGLEFHQDLRPKLFFVIFEEEVLHCSVSFSF
jgi:hypothetical protein